MVRDSLPSQRGPLGQLHRIGRVLMLAWTVVLAASLIWNVWYQNSELQELARSYARTGFEKDVLYRAWNAGHSPVYVPQNEDTPPNPHLAHLPHRDVVTADGLELTIMNPAYMTRQVHEIGRQRSSHHGHITSLNPIREENAPDDWERQALQAFETGSSEVSSIEWIGDQEYLRLMRPLLTEAGCISCHGSQGYKVGDIRGGISSSIPLAPLEALAQTPRLILILCHILIWAIGLTGIGLGGRRFGREIARREEAEGQKRQAERNLEQVWKMESVGRLAAGLAHEINTPLQYMSDNLSFIDEAQQELTTSLQKYHDLGRRAASGQEVSTELQAAAARAEEEDFEFLALELPQAVAAARSGARQVSDLIKGMEELVESPARTRIPTNVNGIIEKTIRAGGKVWDPVATVEFNPDPNLELIEAHPTELGQVILQLLSNACRAVEDAGAAAGAKGRIDITTRQVGDAIEIIVADNGIGIAPENQGKIFDPFFTTREVGQGTGQGLMIAYNVVVGRHGGELTFESERGSGTTFYVRLPVRTTDLAAGE